MNIRPYHPDDKEVLAELERISPQGGSVRVILEREDFTSRSRLYGDENYALLVAEDQGRPIGVIGGAWKRMRVHGKETTWGYIYDLRIHPDYRRQGLGKTLYREVLQRVYDAGAKRIYIIFIHDNKPIHNWFTSAGYALVDVATVCTAPVYRRRPVPVPVHQESNYDAVRDRIEAVYASRDMYPLDGGPYRTSGFQKVYWAEEGDSLAQISVWNYSHEIRERVVELATPLSIAAHTLRILSRIVPVPRIPLPGEHLRSWWAFDPIIQGERGEELMRSVIAQVINDALDAKMGFVNILSGENEPGYPIFHRLASLHVPLWLMMPSDQAVEMESVYWDIRDL